MSLTTGGASGKQSDLFAFVVEAMCACCNETSSCGAEGMADRQRAAPVVGLFHGHGTDLGIREMK